MLSFFPHNLQLYNLRNRGATRVRHWRIFTLNGAKNWHRTPSENLSGPKFCFSASIEATELYLLSTFFFLRDQSVGAVFDYPKGMLYAIFY